MLSIIVSLNFAFEKPSFALKFDLSGFRKDLIGRLKGQFHEMEDVWDLTKWFQ